MNGRYRQGSGSADEDCPVADRRVVLGSSKSMPSETRRTEEPTTSRRSRQSERSRGWYSRGYIPHFDAPGLIQHVTFHLADSLPKDAIERMRYELEAIPEAERSLARRRRVHELLDRGMGSCMLREPACAEVVENALWFGDGGRYRLLAWVVMPNHVHVLIEQLPGWPLGKVVQSWKRHTAREIHRLGFMMAPSKGSPGCGSPSCGSLICGSPSCTRQLKGNADCKSAIQDAKCNLAIRGADCKSAIQMGHGDPWPVWQRDYWDRFVRNERHLLTVIDYIEQNPVAAGLVSSAQAWPWGSARFGGGR